MRLGQRRLDSVNTPRVKVAPAQKGAQKPVCRTTRAHIVEDGGAWLGQKEEDADGAGIRGSKSEELEHWRPHVDNAVTRRQDLERLKGKGIRCLLASDGVCLVSSGDAD